MDPMPYVRMVAMPPADPHRKPASAQPTRDGRRWWWIVLALSIVAAVFRLLYLKWIGPPIPPISDAAGYYYMGVDLAEGHGFVSWTARRFQRKTLYSAAYPPLYPGLLALLRTLGIESMTSQRGVIALLGALNIPLLAILGRAVGGVRTGIIAAVIAACSPFLLQVDGSFMTESLYILLCAAAMVVLLDATRNGVEVKFGLAGLLLGLATLTRSEGVILFGLLAVPLAFIGSAKGRWARTAFALAGFALAVVPWTARNALRFHEFIPVSQSLKGVLVGANCDYSYYGDEIGSWVVPCVARVETKGLSEVQAFDRYQAAGLRYLGNHKDDLPRVVGARILRTFGLFRPGVWFGHGEPEVRNSAFSRRTLWLTWVLLALALLGAVLLAGRSRLHLWLLLAPILTVTLTSAVAYGNPRFRAAAEPCLIVLASLFVSWVWDRVRPERRVPAIE